MAVVAIVTLTSDFGTVDGYAGAMKGVIFARAPDALVVDITHAIGRHDIAAGAFALANAAPQFPPGTIHVAVVDPGVGSTRAPVIVEAGGQLFVAPDNGLLSLVAPAPDRAYVISAPAFMLTSQSTTFHGRDVFAAAAGTLAAGANPADAGPAIELSGSLSQSPGTSGGGRTAAVVVHVDAFGNLITDLSAGALPPRPRFSVAGQTIDKLSAAYYSVDVGQLLAYIGSGNTLEIAVREGNAAARLGVERGAVVYVDDKSE